MVELRTGWRTTIIQKRRAAVLMPRSMRDHQHHDDVTPFTHRAVAYLRTHIHPSLNKGKVFPYSLPSVGPGADPGVQAVSPQVT